MLDGLPNEILHKIFSKTKPRTAKTCRLLSRRYDRLITEYGFNKEHLANFRIHPSYFCEGKESSVTVDMVFNRKKKITSSNYEDMLNVLPQYLNKVGRIERLLVTLVPINDKLLDILNQQTFLRYIRYLDIFSCTNEVKDEKKWFSFLEKLNLKQFQLTSWVEGGFFALPTTILDHVNRAIRVSSNVVNVLAEHPWITDTVVKKWFLIPEKRLLQNETIVPEKVLKFDRTITGMTVHGVIECITQLMKRESKKDYMQEFGILNNTTPELVEQALREARLQWRDDTDDPEFVDQVTTYTIRSEDGQRVYEFFCVDPGRDAY